MKKILCWNVNGIRAIEKKGFIPWLFESGADILCVQETKAKPEQLSKNLVKPQLDGSSYYAYFSSAIRPGYSGTALYTKKEPDEVFTMGISDFDDEGRTLAARFGSTIVISAYFPNSQEAGARLDYKLAYCDAMLSFCDDLVQKGNNIILCGDYNIAHKEIDLANPKANENNPGYLPEERAWMDLFTSSGYCDLFRKFNKEPHNYTWWSYRFQARAKNIGWRIDYQCVNDSFVPAIASSTILSDQMGSDHCPIAIEVDF